MNTQVFSQVNLSIEELFVSNWKITKNELEINEDLERGPYVLLTCRLKNNSKDTVIIHPSSAIYQLSFNYDGDNFTQVLYPLAFMDNTKVRLTPLQSVDFTAGLSILLGTSILKEDCKDYTLELMKILPTLKLIYVEADKLRIVSDRINNVKLNK